MTGQATPPSSGRSRTSDALCQEHELETRSVRRIADLANGETCSFQAAGDLVGVAEPERGFRVDLDAVAVESERLPERHQRRLDVDDLGPRVDVSDVG